MASLYDSASLVMIPSGVKEDKLYSIKPTDGSGDFTFSRGSDIEATRVNSSGLIEKAKVNEILQSNAISTSPWGGTRILSETQGHTGYDGSNNAWLLIPNTDNNTHYKVQSVSTTLGVTTISVYVKSAGYNYLSIRDDSSGSSYARFDLATGVTSITGSNAITSKIESVGNDWWRCSLTYQETAAGNILFYVNNAYDYAPAYSGDGVSGIYFMNVQINHGLVAQDYVETTTTAVVEGLTADLPRLDYSGGASCPSLLLEPSRTNLFPHSEAVGENYSVNAPTITENYAVSPEGVQNAFRIQDTDGSNFKAFNTGSSYLSVSLNSTHTASVFVKKSASPITTYAGFGFDYNGGTRQVSNILFDEYNGTLIAASAPSTLTLHDAEDYGDYWRFSVTAKDTGSNPSLKVQIYACLSINGVSVGIGTKDWTGYGAQLEEGNYSTSYIPTYGTAANRGVDNAVLNNSSALPTALPFTMYVKTNVEDRSSEQIFISLNDSSTSSRYANLSHSNGVWSAQFRPVGTFVVANYTQSITRPDNKVAMVVTDTELKLFLNGVLVKTTTNTQPFNTNMTDLLLGRLRIVSDTGTRDNVAEALMFKTALTDAEAIALTTI